MNIFSKKTTWTTLELGIIKIYLLSAGILIGIKLFSFLTNFETVIWILFGISLFLTLVIGLPKIRKMFQKEPE